MEEDLMNSLNSITLKIDENFNQLSSKLVDLETSNKDVINLSKEIKSLSVSIDEKIKKLSSSVENDVSTTAELKKTISGIDSKITYSTDKLKKSIDDLNMGLKSGVIDSFNKVDSAVKQRGEKIEGFIDTLYSKVKEVFHKNGNLEAEIATEKQNNIDKQSLISKLNKDISIERANSAKLSGGIGALKAEVESLNREIVTEKQNNIDKQSQISKLNEDISNERANSAKLSGDIGVLKAEVESFKSQLITEKENLQNKNEEINKLSSNINEKNKEIESINSEKKELQQQLEKIQNDYNSLNNYYKSFNIDDTLLVAFKEFSSLTDKTKASIEALFPQSSFLGFISAGLRLSNISSLWEMAKRNIFNNNLDDIDKINKIFNLLISVYNEGSKEMQFQIISPEIGSKYDSSTSAIKEMKSSGTVKEVLLVGYKNIKDGNVHKAIISVNE